MGDRCSCSLYLGAPIDDETYEVTVGNLDEPDETSGDRTWLRFEGVNYGELPPFLQAHLVERKIPFAWWNGAGDAYAEGIVLFDGEDVTTWPMLEGEIMLPIKSTSNPAIVAQARKAQTFWEEL